MQCFILQKNYETVILKVFCLNTHTFYFILSIFQVKNKENLHYINFSAVLYI